MITSTTDRDAAISAAERDTIVIWRGERIPLRELPDRIAATDGRIERNGMYEGWVEGVEATNPLRRELLAAWRTAGGVAEGSAGSSQQALSLELERFVLMSETVYFAALRRHLALIGIEQGDATLADAWYIERGSAWSSWFSTRDVERASSETGRHGDRATGQEGWRFGAASLAGDASSDGGVGASAVRELYRWLVADPTWLAGPLRMGREDVTAFADFAAYSRLWNVRKAAGTYLCGLRMAATDDESLQRAYYSGIVGNIVGVVMPEAAYLLELPAPGAEEDTLQHAILAGQMAERLESRFGSTWWTDAEARAATAGLAGTADVTDVLAQLGYDALDWRPLLRQIRTRLIGEMSGYGGPNITTRAGTRKV